MLEGMDEEQQKKYREAADKLWELAEKYHGFQVCDDLKQMASALHTKAGGRQSIIILDGDE